MKKYFILLAALTALPLFQSCVAPHSYGVGYGSARNYGSSLGIIATSHSRWGYDPFHRAYYDFSLGQYYDLSRGRYFTSLPRRYSSPFYPSHYRRGTALRCPNNLPHLHTSFRRPSVGFISTGHSRWSYDPYRRSYYDQHAKKYYNTSSRSYYSSLPRRHSSPSYPSGYRSGQRVQLHSNLPYVNHRTNSHSQSQHSGSSRANSQRSIFTSGRDLRPSVSTTNYRSRSSVSGRPSSTRQSNPTPNRQSTRFQVAPQGQSRPKVTSSSYSGRMEQAAREQAQRAAQTRVFEQRKAESRTQNQPRQDFNRSSQKPSRSSSRPSSGGGGSRGGSQDRSRGSGRQIY